MKKLKTGVYSALGRIYIPEEIRGKKDLILHISDTPLAIYPAIRRLIRKMKPKVIIHTGDLADHIKLEFNEHLMNEFLNDARKIIRIMEFSSADEVYLVMGNHDKYRKVKEMVTRSSLVEMSAMMKIEGHDFHLSHYYEDVITDPRDYNLYGHNPEKKNHKVRTRWFLNGVSSINVIEGSSGKVHELRYPWGTDSYRYRRVKSGL
ncbi:metallophosphoesterase [Proteiniclasticum sp. C24MP]|uniref:metallophosphoesterase n=1 Tax=Proteiniclasticum sp. C24MP TaxID=3374101 RepID=UPI0037545249